MEYRLQDICPADSFYAVPLPLAQAVVTDTDLLCFGRGLSYGIHRAV